MSSSKYKVGDKIGRLTILEKSERCRDSKGRRRSYWICECECGSVVEKREDVFTRPVPSCGCYGREQMSAYMREKMTGKIKYGDSRERVHNIWYLMKFRCEDSSSPAYQNYGGRGITVCPEWSDGIDGYFRFKEWALSNGYTDELSLDRIDNDKGYSPDNCRWVGTITQANNKRSNVFYEFNGTSKTLAQWARDFNINYKTVHRRVVGLGWELERALMTPVGKIANIAQT